MATRLGLPVTQRAMRANLRSILADATPEHFAQGVSWYADAQAFTAPIGIVRPPRGPWLQHNGHHRIVAAILLCMDEVPVVFIDREVDDDDGIFDATGGYDWDDYDYGQSALDDAEWLYQQVTIR